jgi:hypothetical protein
MVEIRVKSWPMSGNTSRQNRLSVQAMHVLIIEILLFPALLIIRT